MNDLAIRGAMNAAVYDGLPICAPITPPRGGSLDAAHRPEAVLYERQSFPMISREPRPSVI